MSTKKLTIDDYINRASIIHNNYYTYDKTIYLNIRTQIIITCPKHGDFLIRPDLHISNRKSGCKLCNNGVITGEDFISIANIKHNNTYDYSHINYKNKNVKIHISCKKHGLFEQSPQKHLNGQGCPKCCGKNKTTEEFIIDARYIHGDRYDYSKSIYSTAKNKLDIICNKHGMFSITPTSHLSGSGCSKCGFNTSLAGDKWIESFNNTNIIPEQVIKVNGRKFKVDGIDYTTNTIYEYFGSFWHGNPNRKDIVGTHPFLNITYSELYDKTIEKIKFLEENGFQLIYEWGR